jgi:two-component system, cell cycle sensor histidine kinase and response regulator CckA
MISSLLQKRWLPYFIASTGTIFSLLLYYLARQAQPACLDLLSTYPGALAWIALFLGLSFTAFKTIIVCILQLTQQRTATLRAMNESLKNEIHERIQAEETRQRLEIALLQGQKLQAMGTLAGGIAHDFNNILYAILGYTEMAREDVEKDSLVHKNLGKIIDGSRRGQELVARILAFSRRQPHHFTTLDLAAVIEAALALLTPTIPASVAIQFNIHNTAKIWGNQTQIHQVLVNLINNAVDALEDEGKINIDLELLSNNDQIRVEFPTLPAKAYCKLSLSDTGHGMDDKTLARIFEPFYTTKEVGKGTGLGLSIVHSIIKEHQGEITVHSQLGHGSLFVILLPIIEIP